MNKKLSSKTTLTKKKIAFGLLGVIALITIFLCVNVLRQVVYGVFGYAIYAYLPAMLVSTIFLLLGKKINLAPKRIAVYVSLFVMVIVTLHVGLSKEIVEGSSYFANTYASKTVGGVLVGLIAAIFRLICAKIYGVTFAVTFVITAILGLVALYPFLLEIGHKEARRETKRLSNQARAPQTNNLRKNANGDYVETSSALNETPIYELDKQAQTGVVNVSGVNNELFATLTSEEDRVNARANKSASLLFGSNDEIIQTTPNNRVNGNRYSTLNLLGSEQGMSNYINEQERLRSAQESLRPRSSQEEFESRFGFAQQEDTYSPQYFAAPINQIPLQNTVPQQPQIFTEPVKPSASVEPQPQNTNVIIDRSQALEFVTTPISGEELLSRDFDRPVRTVTNDDYSYMFDDSYNRPYQPVSTSEQVTNTTQVVREVEPSVNYVPNIEQSLAPKPAVVPQQAVQPYVQEEREPFVEPVESLTTTQPVQPVTAPSQPVKPAQSKTEVVPVQQKFNLPPKPQKPVYTSNVMAKETAPAFPVEQKEKKPYVPKPYKVPSYDLLRTYSTSSTTFPEDYNAVKQKLDQTMQEFDVPAEVFDAKRGPTFTMYYLNVGTGYRLSKVESLKDNLKMRLCVKNLRIHAPVAGQNALGIELPNSNRETVGLKSILCSKEFNQDSKGLKIAMGKNLEGEPYIADITKMPHMLVAGSTGTGKSVFLNALLTSLLFKYSPEDLRMVLIDPKKVELTVYRNLPNLLIKEPIKEAKHAVNALKWLCQEMDRRYDFFSKVGCSNIDQYNELYKKDTDPKMYRILLVIDEMADLMINSKDSSVEEYIVRIAQLARACGIHMVIATQRPTVKVITGLIKSNIIHRVAFTVKTNMDSRVILDEGGAEELLGIGDMLYSNPNGLVRMQGAFIDIAEIKAVCDYIRENNESDYDETIAAAVSYEPPKPETVEERNNAREEERDAEFEKQLQTILKSFILSGRASVSSAQASHRVGYIKAKKLVDAMAERGFLSQGDGAKPRDILITLDEWEELFGENAQRDYVETENYSDDED